MEEAVLFSHFPGLRNLIELYAELDEQVDQLKKIANLDCPKHCQECCTPAWGKIEVSVFECLPLSIHLWQREEAESLLQKIAQSKIEDPCVLSNGDPSRPNGWGCKYYSWRPLICRLFGFSGVRNKRGETKIALCRPVKESDPRAEERMNQEIARGLAIPIIPHLAQRAALLNPHLGQKKYGVNQGLKIALEKVGFQFQFYQDGMTRAGGLK